MAIKQSDKKKVEIEVPTIKLSLADLSYLNGLIPGNLACDSYYSNRSHDRCLFLGLIEQKEFPPCPKLLKKFHDQQAAARPHVDLAYKEERWSDLRDMLYKMISGAPASERRWVLTKAGEDILKRGRAFTTTADKGCAK